MQKVIETAILNAEMTVSGIKRKWLSKAKVINGSYLKITNRTPPVLL